MVSEFRTVFAGENDEIQCTDFEDGILFIKDAEGDTIMISKDQLIELIDKLKGE
jgi:hypothetical protein